MLRSIFINRGESIRVSEGWVIIEGVDCDGRVPLEDVYSVVIDNPRVSLSSYALAQLSQNNAHVIVCNDKHMPTALILPLKNHYRPLNVLKRQLALSVRLKNKIWRKIVIGKIGNQLNILKHINADSNSIELLTKYMSEVTGGDSTNREGLAAKVFFRSIYGSQFIRNSDDAINAALNYGYSIVRSTVAKHLCAYGYHCEIGVHHVSETNPFNLAEDFMEPFRPIVDLWVESRKETLVDTLNLGHRKELAALCNRYVTLGDKRMTVRNAIEKMTASYSSTLETEDVERFLIPCVDPQLFMKMDLEE